MPQKDKAKKVVAMLGYGSQGRALALNLRDSGYDVVIGLPPDSESRALASEDGFAAIEKTSEAVSLADSVCFAFPDYLQGRVWESVIRDNVQSGSCLWFLHGLSVHFGYVEPPESCDVILIAPHAPGVAVREKFKGERDISAFYAVHQDHTGTAKSTAFELAEACGFKKERLVETSFEDEALGDIFGEQTVLCGGLAALIKNGFEVLVENGIKPEHAWLEVGYQIDLIVELIKKHGIEGMFDRVSVAARFGSLEAGPAVVGKEAKAQMQARFAEIKSGNFTDRLNRLQPDDIENLRKSLKKLSHPELERAARKYSG